MGERGMDGMVEKFTISRTDEGVEISSKEGVSLSFTALEALMVLDILQEEEPHLRRMADALSPLPMQIRFEKKE
jgi:hypothetical protein